MQQTREKFDKFYFARKPTNQTTKLTLLNLVVLSSVKTLRSVLRLYFPNTVKQTQVLFEKKTQM